ncbi:MAG: hypothetical protein Q9181_000429 [Wetmoreana brouardii]
MDNLVQNCHDKLSKDSAILTEGNPLFAAAHERWTDLDCNTPSVIVQPKSGQDVTVLVKEVYAANACFVPATGGHSTWPTVEHDMVIDLSQYKEAVVDPGQRTVAVRGGDLMKELQVAPTVAYGKTVGAIPYMIGGGVSSYNPLIGYACEKILSARRVVASDNIVEATDAENKGLLWAIRGAGEFFRTVTELGLRTYDPFLVGPDGVHVASAKNHACAGHVMAMNDPSKGRVIMVAPQYFGTVSEPQATFKPLTDMELLAYNHMSSTLKKHSDHLG